MASTVLDSFVLELSLDTQKLSKGQRDAIDQLRKFEQESTRTGKSIEAQGTKIVNLFAEVSKATLGAIGIFAGGAEAKKFLDYIVNLDASTGRLAYTMNVSATELSAWQGAIKQMGGSAESANSGLAGLSSEMTRFTLTGQSSILPVLSRLGVSLFDQNRNLKSAGQLWLDLSDAVKGMDPRQAAAFLQMIPGANQDMINLAILGPKAMKAALDASRAVGVTTKESSEAAKDFSAQLTLLDGASTELGRTLFTITEPSLAKVLKTLTNISSIVKDVIINLTKAPKIGGDSVSPFALGPQISPATSLGTSVFMTMAEYFFPQLKDKQPSVNDGGALGDSGARAGAGGPSAPGTAPGYTASVAEIEAYIRQAAIKRGIDPDVAVGVYRSEGKGNYSGDRGTSFGPFQLHVGGGLGDSFQGNLRDPNTWKDQVDYSLDTAPKTGWGPWHGWNGHPSREGLPNPGASLAPGVVGSDKQSMNGGSNTTISGIQVTVNAPNAKDTPSAMHEVGPALERSLYAGAANYGQA